MVGNLNALTSTATTATPNQGGAGGEAPQAEKGQGPEKFGDVWNKIQAQYGEKNQKPREIKKTLGKDDFLKIMVMQMRNQDPTKPFDPEQMGQQMAQFASVEQLQNINKSLDRMTTQNSPTEKMAMTQMIGKWVTLDRSRFQHTEGAVSNLSFELPKDAASVNVQVVNEMGEPIYSKSLGELKSGQQSVNWDGIKSNTMPAKSGTYNVRVVAADKNGASIPIHTVGQSQVIGVSFEGNEPTLLVGDNKNFTKIGLKLISKISTDKDPAVTDEKAAPKTGVEGILAGAVEKPKEKANLTQLKAPEQNISKPVSKNEVAMNAVISSQDPRGWPSGLQPQNEQKGGE